MMKSFEHAEPLSVQGWATGRSFSRLARSGAVVGLAALAAALAVVPAMAITPVSGWVSTDPALGFYNPTTDMNQVTSYNLDFPIWYGTPAPLAASSSYQQYFPFTGTSDGFAGGTSAVTANWASAASGNVNFNDSFQLSLTHPDDTEYLPVGYSFETGWTYNFTPTTNATLTLNYNIVALGDNAGGDFGVIYLQSGLNGDGVPIALTGSGVYSESLIAGGSYQISLFTPDLTYYDQPVFAEGQETGDFDWNIAEVSGVPEPSMWMLTIAGVGLGGLGLRRRRGQQLGVANPLG